MLMLRQGFLSVAGSPTQSQATTFHLPPSFQEPRFPAILGHFQHWEERAKKKKEILHTISD